MGMYDSVLMWCRCGGQVEWQSKAGECALQTFTPDAMPPEIAADLKGDTASCDKCGRVYYLGERPKDQYVALKVIAEDEDET